MKSDNLTLKESLRRTIEQTKDLTVQDTEKIVFQVLEEMAAEGKISFGEDYRLGQKSLELRVKHIFRQMQFVVENGREGLEDAIIRSQEGLKTPLVVEIKSSKSLSPSRDDLRQLDDYVFELSGEENARKEGLGGGVDLFSSISHGLISRRHYHPSPHKGVFIFNGPTTVPFEKRRTDWIGDNEFEFSKKRNFCLMSFNTVIVLFNEYQKDKSIATILWKKIHETQGELTLEEMGK